MKHNSAKRTREKSTKMSRSFSNITKIISFLILVTIVYCVIAFTPMTKEEQMTKMNKITEEVEPFRKNLSECARQVKASMVDVESFLKRIPQSSMQGKCLVACILKRNRIIEKNKVVKENLLKANKEVYGEDSEVVARMERGITECSEVVQDIFEVCEYASMFNDCMHMKMEHILDKLTMERRMEALGQMSSDPEQWTEDEDDLLKLVRDEL